MKVRKKRITSGDKTLDNLYSAVIKYLNYHGGTAVTIGGMAIVQEEVSEHKFGIMIRILGNKPTDNFNQSNIKT